jgi:K+/H+ antiporter YhaU regulatory subunit KhtT
MSASRLLGDGDAVASTQYVDVVRRRVPALEGMTVADAAIGERTGCTVVVIERDGRMLTDVGPNTTIEVGDELVVLGTDEGISTFERTFE